MLPHNSFLATGVGQPKVGLSRLHVSAESQQILGTLQELLQAHYSTALPGVVVDIDHDCLCAQLRTLARRWCLSSKAVLQELFALRGGALILAFLSLLKHPSVRAFLRSASFYMFYLGQFLWENSVLLVRLVAWLGATSEASSGVYLGPLALPTGFLSPFVILVARGRQHP